jgi:hypothetical protein
VVLLLPFLQVQKIRLLLRQRGLVAVRVGTVDDYQVGGACFPGCRWLELKCLCLLYMLLLLVLCVLALWMTTRWVEATVHAAGMCCCCQTHMQSTVMTWVASDWAPVALGAVPPSEV